VQESEEVGKSIIVDFDLQEQPVGIEILNASKLFGGKIEVSIALPLPESIDE
jgi:uncharacterized protein YuzE